MSKKKKVTSVLTTLIVAIIAACLITWFTASDANKSYMMTLVGNQSDSCHERQIDWDSLPPEVIAWVEVPDTRIDEPIVQASPAAPNAYLRIDAMGQGGYGTPYIDCDCNLDSDLVMIYGHHMSDGSQFADFANFIDPAYAEDHSEIILYIRDGDTLHLKPMAVDIVNASREQLNLMEPELQKLLTDSDLLFEPDAHPSKLIAFTTCSYQTWNSRTVVYACSGDISNLANPNNPSPREGELEFRTD